MFALDLDLANLKERQPSVYAEFEQGTFVVQKSQHLTSEIFLDHNHEKKNEMIKRDSGAVGLTESSSLTLDDSRT